MLGVSLTMSARDDSTHYITCLHAIHTLLYIFIPRIDYFTYRVVYRHAITSPTTVTQFSWVSKLCFLSYQLKYTDPHQNFWCGSVFTRPKAGVFIFRHKAHADSSNLCGRYFVELLACSMELFGALGH